ncbi:hypothetical protein BV22DRAFT_1132037 [Leucogyrophana mollusca]|uniref:Uncharacterized protein n=1 Tax=Leucogyrophana mollusca TaxID=85980 RepID=A0ACB8B7K2_9AGAM|nr:hypothetical protein BV22DRAFT_1132037 [Leucogyrophana mollusca]
MATVLLILGVLASSGAFALPAARQLSASCNLTEARLQVPANQTQLIAPTVAPAFVALGLGVQNYTCNATSSTYVLTGAVAELFDSSCLYGTPVFDTAPALAYTAWDATTGLVTPQDVIAALSIVPLPVVLGQHYYVPNPAGSGLSPKWDFTSSGGTYGNTAAYAVGAKIGDLPSPDTKLNIDSLMVKVVEGNLASEIFRVQNNGGQPPASCTSASQNVSVKYTAQYWFFGGSITPNSIVI